MKVFFTASLKGKQYYEQNYKAIYSYLETLGLSHLDSDLLALSRAKYYADLEISGRVTHEDMYKKKTKAIQLADFCVFDVTFPSLSTGFLIEKSLHYHKPTVVLFLEGNTPYFLDGIVDDRFIIHSYSEDTIHSVLDSTIADARKKREQRFNFFLTPGLISFLEEASSKRGMTKSAYIRSLIEEDMNKPPSIRQ